jgi:uncharacterized membrane-anchored protein
VNAGLPLPGIALHPLRELLNDEFHARPPVPLRSPTLVSHLVFTHDASTQQEELANLQHLGEVATGELLDQSEAHLVFAAQAFLLRWERHSEFSSYTVFRALAAGEGRNPAASALEVVPASWLSAIPGQLIAATHVELHASREVSPESVTAGLTPTGRQVVAAQVADQAAWVFTDFMFDSGFSRFLILDVALTQRQAGRTVQRLLEIETYRLLALLALPIAKEIGGWLKRAEAQFADLVDQIGQARSPADERRVLAALTGLAAEVEHSLARTAFRFGAARAYHDLVMQRIDELRELRVSGLPDLPRNDATPPASGDADLHCHGQAPGRSLRSTGTFQRVAAHPCRRRTRTPEPGTTGADEPARTPATALAGNGRRACRW